MEKQTAPKKEVADRVLEAAEVKIDAPIELDIKQVLLPLPLPSQQPSSEFSLNLPGPSGYPFPASTSLLEGYKIPKKTKEKC